MTGFVIEHSQDHTVGCVPDISLVGKFHHQEIKVVPVGLRQQVAVYCIERVKSSLRIVATHRLDVGQQLIVGLRSASV